MSASLGLQVLTVFIRDDEYSFPVNSNAVVACNLIENICMREKRTALRTKRFE